MTARLPDEQTQADQERAAAARRRQSGLTLLELLVVITILGLLAAVIGTVAIDRLGKARSDTTRLQIDQISAGLDLYRLDVGRYPTEEEGLIALVEDPGDANGWSGPYLQKRQTIVDPWGRPFFYVNPGRNGEVDIYSLGADNAEGGDGENEDVKSW